MKSLFVIVSLISTVGFALDMSTQKWTAQLDLRQTASQATAACTTGCTADTQTMFSAGATTMFDLGNQFGLRTGGVVTQRGYKQTAASISTAANFTYLDIPVLPEYQINEMFTAYAGVVVGLKASRTCDFGGTTCSDLSDKSLVTPLQVGGTYNIDKQWAARLTYETGTVMTAGTGANTDVKTANVVTVGGGYTF